MSMRDYPVTVPVAFLVDAEVSAYLMVKRDKENDYVPDDVQKILDAGNFVEDVKNKNKVLEAALYFNVEDAEEILSEFEVEHVFYSNFDGEVNNLDRQLNETGVSKNCSEDYIVFIEPRYLPSLFHAPYKSIDEVLSEFKEALRPLGDFPPDFDWASKLVSISGTNFA